MRNVVAIIGLVVVCALMCLVPVHRWEDCKYCGIPVELGTLQADNNWSEDGRVICSDCFVGGHRR